MKSSKTLCVYEMWEHEMHLAVQLSMFSQWFLTIKYGQETAKRIYEYSRSFVVAVVVN